MSAFRTTVKNILVAVFLLAAGGAWADGSPNAVELAASDDVMQCMANCIRHEGNTATAKSTCKLRCANVKMPAAGGGRRDCMAVYKDCNRACPKSDKKCRRACKSALMECK